MVPSAAQQITASVFRGELTSLSEVETAITRVDALWQEASPQERIAVSHELESLMMLRSMLDSDGLTKGEGTGHPFRGNRYTGGVGGGETQVSSRALATAKVYEERWRAEKPKVEQCAAIRSDGTLLLQKTGDDSSVKFDPIEAERVEGAEVFTHWHPEFEGTKEGNLPGGSFSPNDLNFAASLGIKDMIAVDSSTTYEMRIPPEVRGPWGFNLEAGGHWQEYSEAQKRLIDNLGSTPSERARNWSMAVDKALDRQLEKFAEQCHCQYLRHSAK